MSLDNLIFSFLIFSFLIVEAQIPDDFGYPKNSEYDFTTFKKDTTAGAVVLYEKGDHYFTTVDNRTVLRKNYHVKIKIINKKGFESGNITLPLYFNTDNEEKLTHIRAITHNKRNTFEVTPGNIFTSDISENWRHKTFTFPNIKSGSILEYAYTVETPFYFNFTGWEFQREIPVVYSEFNAFLPGNWKYNYALYGDLDFSVNEKFVKEDCFLSASCEVLKYIMEDIPAFEEDENYMLAKSNYISRIEFELAEYKSVVDGHRYKYSKTWKDADREFKKDKDIGKQLFKAGFFDKHIPENILTEDNQLQKAKNIFEFIKEHYTWNEKFGIYKKARVKEAFNQKTGSVSEINISLVNLLNHVGFNSNLVLLSTRKNGLPKKVYPVITDFNYCIANVKIDGVDYLLDATDKYMPFGMLPFRALNRYGRVMDFKNDSYWLDIIPQKNNKVVVRANLKFDLSSGLGKGAIDVANLGYNAVYQKETLETLSTEEYLNEIEDGSKNLSFISHKRIDDSTDEKKVVERFQFEIEDALDSDIVYLNPFLMKFFESNPFLLEKRNFPVDFGYPRSYKYQINIEIPDGYSIDELPKKKVVQMPNEQAVLQFDNRKTTKGMSLILELKLNNYHIQPENYVGLKELFTYVTDIQNNSLIVLKRQ
jgi:hypothetical protein